MKTEKLLDGEFTLTEVNGVSFAEIEELLQKPLKMKDTWYLLSRQWYDQFRGHTGLDGIDCVSKDHPGPMDNSSIIDGETDELKDHLIEDVDYVIVPEELWVLLLSWYGLTNGQTAIPKKVVEYGVFNSYCKVEVIGLTLILWKQFDADTAHVGKFSHGDTTAEIHAAIREIYKVPSYIKSRLWGGFSPNVYDPLESADRSTISTGLYHNQVVVLELLKSDGEWTYQYRRMKLTCNKEKKKMVSYPAMPSDKGASAFDIEALDFDIGASALSASQESSPPAVPESSVEPVVEGASSISRKTAVKRVAAPSIGRPLSDLSNLITRGSNSNSDTDSDQRVIPGLCGLSNLGNTCFMNAVVQCISNCPSITTYFRASRHLDELNTENPLGMGGEIAMSYAELVKTMWSGECSFALPHVFKQKVGAFAPSFSGYQQQDAQELLTFLLDGLHEDLNRIHEKPYIELRDSNGRPDSEVSEEAWLNYLRRNDSIIVDYFHGLLKSTVVCPDCKRVSVTFDPFVYLSLPLPIIKERTIDLVVFFYDPNVKPVRYKFTVPRNCTVGEMAAILGGHCNIPGPQLLVVQVMKSHFHLIFDKNQSVAYVDDRENICVYELPACASDAENYAVLPVLLWENNSHTNTGSTNQLFGHPFVVVIARSQLTYMRIYAAIMRKLKLFMYDTNDNSNTHSYLASQPDQGLNYRGINEEDMIPTPADDNRVVGGNGTSEQNLFTLYFANDPELRDMILMPPDGNSFTVPAVIGRRACVVSCTPAVKAHYYDGSALKNMVLKDLSSNSASETLNLTECFEHYTVEEKLGVKDTWYCPNCKKHKCASKKFDLWHMPPILVVHLKRFCFTRYKRSKLDMMVDAPLVDMDLSEFVIGPNKTNSTYNLIGVTNHSGNLGGGHYTASCLNHHTNKWYHFDDASVSPLPEGVSPVCKGTYVLFYMRSDVYGEEMETD